MAKDTPNKQYLEMLAKWELPLALVGGTPKMREGKKRWLPQEPRESDEAYDVRLQRTFLFNFYHRAIRSLVGSAFASNITVTGLPDKLKYLEWNVNGEGQSITELAAKMFEDALIYGKAHTYTDFPDVEEGVSYAEYKERGYRPYIARVSPLSVIGWKHEFQNGFEKLKYVRIKEKRLEEDEDTFEQNEVTVVRYISDSEVVVWKEEAVVTPTGSVYGGDQEVPENFIIENQHENTLGEVPLVCAYANKRSPFVTDPTLEDLAWINLCHYQSSSDQRNILHIARVPFLLGTGFDEAEVDNVEIAANRMVLSSNDKANIKYVEHTGQAIAAGDRDLRALEEQASKAGAEILFSQSVARQTATGRKIDQAEALNITQLILRSIEQALEQSIIYAAKWLDIDTEGFEPSVSIGVDLDLPTDPNPVQSLIDLQQFINLKDERLLEELKRRKLIAPHVTENDVDFQSLKEAIETRQQLTVEPEQSESQSGEVDEDLDNDASTTEDE